MTSPSKRKRPPMANAEQQRRYRERQKERSDSVTRDVTARLSLIDGSTI